MKVKDTLFILILVSFGLMVYSQEHGHEQSKEHNKFRHHSLALFTGYTLIPQAVNLESGEHKKSALSENGLDKEIIIVPTLGLDYEYMFNHKFGISLQNDIELSTYYVEKDHEEILTREYAFVTALVFLYEPVHWFALFVGPGYEFEQHESFFVGKIGTDFMKKFEQDWAVAVTLAVDVKEVNTSPSFGITIIKGLGKPR